MGRPPRTVRGIFLDHPRSLFEACIRETPGTRGEAHVREELRELEKEGLLVKGAGRCGACHRNDIVWRRPSAGAP